MSLPTARLALGTAQFGLPYGATNRAGRVARKEVERILAAAAAAGIGLLDTAPAYGSAEAVLGGLTPLTRPFRIVTKTLPGPAGQAIGGADLADIAAAIEGSCRRLGRRPLDVLIVHHGCSLLRPGGDRLLGLLHDAKASGQCSRIGVSVYDPEELDGILDLFMPDVVQLPFNLLDQRFLHSGLLARLSSSGVEVHARSLFLQGTLLAPAAALPPHLGHLVEAVAAVDRFARDHGLAPVEACLGFGLSQPGIAALVLGVTAADELETILRAADRALDRFPACEHLVATDPRVVNPSRWPRPNA